MLGHFIEDKKNKINPHSLKLGTLLLLHKSVFCGGALIRPPTPPDTNVPFDPLAARIQTTVC